MSKRLRMFILSIISLIVIVNVVMLAIISSLNTKISSYSGDFLGLSNKVAEMNRLIEGVDQTKSFTKTQEEVTNEAIIKNIGNGHWGNICSQDKVIDGRVDAQSAIVFFDKASCPPPFKTIRVWVQNGTGK